MRPLHSNHSLTLVLFTSVILLLASGCEQEEQCPGPRAPSGACACSWSTLEPEKHEFDLQLYRRFHGFELDANALADTQPLVFVPDTNSLLFGADVFNVDYDTRQLLESWVIETNWQNVNVDEWGHLVPSFADQPRAFHSDLQSPEIVLECINEKGESELTATQRIRFPQIDSLVVARHTAGDDFQIEVHPVPAADHAIIRFKSEQPDRLHDDAFGGNYLIRMHDILPELRTGTVTAKYAGMDPARLDCGIVVFSVSRYFPQQVGEWTIRFVATTEIMMHYPCSDLQGFE